MPIAAAEPTVPGAFGAYPHPNQVEMAFATLVRIMIGTTTAFRGAGPRPAAASQAAPFDVCRGLILCGEDSSPAADVHVGPTTRRLRHQIGRASCRERGEISV